MMYWGDWLAIGILFTVASFLLGMVYQSRKQ
jgi:hypothetical protein